MKLREYWFCHGGTRGLYWFRVFGVGLWFASYVHHEPLFSERNGRVRVWRFGSWRVKVLT